MFYKLRIVLVPIRNGPTGVILVSLDSFSFTITRSTYSTAKSSCLVSKYVSILGTTAGCAMRGHLCATWQNYITLHHTVGIGIGTFNYLCHWAILYLIYHGAQQVAAALACNLAFIFQSLPRFEMIHGSDGDNDTMRVLSPVLTQHSSGLVLQCFTMKSISACAADAAAGLRCWMWMSSPRWHFLPVQLATGNESDNTNSHWSIVFVLLLADYAGGLWPQAVLCRGPVSGLTQGRAIRIYYAKRSSCILCRGSVKLWYCSFWTLGANPRSECCVNMFRSSHLVCLTIWRIWTLVRVQMI